MKIYNKPITIRAKESYIENVFRPFPILKQLMLESTEEHERRLDMLWCNVSMGAIANLIGELSKQVTLKQISQLRILTNCGLVNFRDEYIIDAIHDSIYPLYYAFFVPELDALLIDTNILTKRLWEITDVNNDNQISIL